MLKSLYVWRAGGTHAPNRLRPPVLTAVAPFPADKSLRRRKKWGDIRALAYWTYRATVNKAEDHENLEFKKAVGALKP